VQSVHITKRLVDSLTVGSLIFDTAVKGFAVRCQRKQKTYLLKVRLNGRQRWFTIGEHGAPWTVEAARHEAQRLWGEIREGTDLATIREAKRDKPTMAALCQRYLDEHAIPHKKPSSVRMDRLNIDNHILPALRDQLVTDIGREDVERMKRMVATGKTVPRRGSAKRGPGSVLTGGEGVANRCVALMSKMLNLAEVWGWRPLNSNPCRIVAKFSENPCQRFLSEAEARRLGEVLADAEATGTEHAYIIAAIRLLLLTGARSGEILTLKWQYVDFDRAVLHLPDSKTGQKTIFLNTAAVEVLRAIPRHKNTPYVIAGHKPGVAVTNIHAPWHRIRTLAELEDVRIHDLRHSFASVAAASGASLLMIGKLLGHTNAMTTQRYAHLIADPIKDLNQAVGSKIAQSLVPKPKPRTSPVSRKAATVLAAVKDKP
jgi:Phage integrase family/Arm DNA-binding domain